MKKGIIIIPACNEAVSLEHFLPRLRGVARKMENTEIDIIVIDDGSTDNTTKVVTDAGCQILSNDENRGLGYSLRRGYQTAVEKGHDFLVSMDSDGQHDVNLLRPVIEKLSNNVDLITCSRYHPESPRFNPPLDRDLLNIAVTAMIRAVTGWEQITDPLTGFWGMNQRVAVFLAENLKLERYGTCLEALIKIWYLMDPRPKLAEIPHPAIYTNRDGDYFLSRVYSAGQQEERIHRFGTHARHILKALQDVQAAGFEQEVNLAIAEWRQQLLRE